MDWLLLLLSPFIGSFVGVQIRRLPRGQPVVLARSACEACGHPLAPWDMVPLLSFMALRGRCRFCGADIGWFHPAAELASMLIALWAILADPARAWENCALGWTLLALAWIDWDHMRLPDALTLPLVLGGLAVTWLTTPELASEHALAAAVGYLLFRGTAAAYRWLRGRDGLGAGDAKLLAAAGAWIGLAGLPNVVLFAALIGIAGALLPAAAGARVTASTRLPFGPPLALATWIVRVHGPLL